MKCSAIKRSPSTPVIGRYRSYCQWLPTIDGKVIPGIGGRTRRDAVISAVLAAAGKHYVTEVHNWEEFGVDKRLLREPRRRIRSR
jgi:hypothetical protein